VRVLTVTVINYYPIFFLSFLLHLTSTIAKDFIFDYVLAHFIYTYQEFSNYTAYIHIHDNYIKSYITHFTISFLHFPSILLE